MLPISILPIFNIGAIFNELRDERQRKTADETKIIRLIDLTRLARIFDFPDGESEQLTYRLMSISANKDVSMMGIPRHMTGYGYLNPQALLAAHIIDYRETERTSLVLQYCNQTSTVLYIIDLGISGKIHVDIPDIILLLGKKPQQKNNMGEAGQELLQQIMRPLEMLASPFFHIPVEIGTPDRNSLRSVEPLIIRVRKLLSAVNLDKESYAWAIHKNAEWIYTLADLQKTQELIDKYHPEELAVVG